MSKKTLDRIVIKACENLPFGLTFFEKEATCQKPSKFCSYCKKIGKTDSYSCNKRTYVFNSQLQPA